MATNISDTVTQTINSLFGNLFSSIDSNLYKALDSITFITTDIINSSSFEKIFGKSSSSGFLLIANALLVGFIIYYFARHMLSSFAIVESENPYKFILKLIIIGICMNSSFYICEQIISINSLISDSVRGVGKDFLHTEICFSSLVTKLNLVIYKESASTNIFSIDGIIKSVISIGFFNLIFSYSIRYIMIKVFVLISPFSILCLSTKQTAIFFKSWLKCFIALLLTEILASVILIVMFSISYSSNDLIFKLLFIGSIFALMKANTYVREFIGGISTDLGQNVLALSSMFRN